MKFSKESWIIAIGCVVIAGAEALYFKKREKKILESVADARNAIDKAADDISKNLDVSVPSQLIEKAVDKAVERESSRQVKYAVVDMVEDLKTDMKKNIKSNVDQAYGDTKLAVKQELERQIKNLSIESIKKEVIDEAKRTAADRFKQDLDDILDKHNQELDKVTDIYSSIAKSMRGDK